MIRRVVSFVICFLLAISARAGTASIDYRHVESGTINGRRFRRYEALLTEGSHRDSCTVSQWATAVSTGSKYAIEHLNQVLRDAPYTAFYFETPATTANNINKPFEFVLVEAVSLASKRTNFQSFSEVCMDNIREQSKLVCVFPNFSGRSEMIVPVPIDQQAKSDQAYAHLANFVRNAPPNNVQEFWKTSAETYLRRVGEYPLWLSTAGTGVSWLHLRLDQSPKYYKYSPYKQVLPVERTEL